MQVLTIRPARSSDLPQLTHLWHEQLILRQQTDMRLRLGDDAPRHWAKAAESWLDAPDRAFFVAHTDAEVLGFIMASLQRFPPGALPGVLGVVVDLVVDLHQQGGGVGRALFAALRTWFVEQGVQQVIIRAPERSTVGQAFWRSQGAAEVVGWLWLKL
ncbi:MAG: GNAT family N-acetyltransferase [Anaerolineae bacterium]|nr:GNAT family N-acetyltransferase [Anaerolineae bacterium]